MAIHRYPGALHMHTLYSDGSGTVAELARAAQQHGLRWIIITDHDTLQALPEAGYYERTLVIVGYEITPQRNHFLALNVNHVISAEQPPQQFIDQVYAYGGFGIIAHPDERVANAFKDNFRWEDWHVSGPSVREGRVAGLELWNVMSDWGEHLTRVNALPLVLAPQLVLTGPSLETLAWWDQLNIEGKRTFGVFGVDAHAIKRELPWGGQLTVLPYEWIFGTGINYLLLDAPLAEDAASATHQVYAALTAGRFYMVNRLLGDGDAVVFEALHGQQTYQIGDTVALAGGVVTLHAHAGLYAQLRLIHNGRLLADSFTALRHTIAEPGIYRIEGYRRGQPWLYTNPIYVRA